MRRLQRLWSACAEKNDGGRHARKRTYYLITATDYEDACHKYDLFNKDESQLDESIPPYHDVFREKGRKQ